MKDKFEGVWWKMDKKDNIIFCITSFCSLLFFSILCRVFLDNWLGFILSGFAISVIIIVLVFAKFFEWIYNKLEQKQGSVKDE